MLSPNKTPIMHGLYIKTILFNFKHEIAIVMSNLKAVKEMVQLFR